MAAPAWAWRSAANWPAFWAARSSLRSTPGTGSTFKLYLPRALCGPDCWPCRVPGQAAADPRPPTSGAARPRHDEQVPDDRADIDPGDTVLLVVEDDPHYARILMDLAHDEGFKVVAAMRGDDALELAMEYIPAAVSLDIFLPDMLGWTVLSN